MIAFTTEQATTIASVEITVQVNGQTQTFTARATTTGDPAKAARGLIQAVSGDAGNWTFGIEDGPAPRGRLA